MKMKKINYIFILFAALFCSCNEIPQPGSETEITLPTNPYIYFDAAINSRAALESGSTLEDDFAVYGYTYEFNNTWETYRVTAKPNVFDNVPQNVTYSKGNYTYTPIKEWQGGKYTFFAVFPQDLDVSKDVEGTPYVNYNLNFNKAERHIDIMTAMFEDTSLSSSPYVYFDFYHRLSAVDVVALNFYEHSYDDPNAENTVITEKATIELVDLSLDFENVQYKSAKIYMDRRMSSVRTDADPGTNPTYNIYEIDDAGYRFEIDYNNDATLKPVSSVFGKSMIFIPQENTDLKVTTNVSYRIEVSNEYGTTYLPVTDEDGNIVTDADDNPVTVFTQTITTPFNQPLKEGSRYYIQMTFTSSAVSINIITSEEWDEKPVDYEFE